MDNLQSSTYQTFEQDPVKYHNYEEAIYRALMDWPKDIEVYVVYCRANFSLRPDS
jgi:protein arginine N-methyltransferase 5